MAKSGPRFAAGRGMHAPVPGRTRRAAPTAFVDEKPDAVVFRCLFGRSCDLSSSRRGVDEDDDHVLVKRDGIHHLSVTSRLDFHGPSRCSGCFMPFKP